MVSPPCFPQPVLVETERVQSINPSSEGMALVKSIERQASLATGIPDITVPLFSVSSAGLSYSLQYLAGGLLADELPTSNGLGWYLQGGAAIYRVVQGLPDELPAKGYFARKLQYPSLFSLNVGQLPPQSADQLLQLAQAGDGMPDTFYYDIFGVKGKFILDGAGNAVCFPANNLKISYTVDDAGQVGAFTVSFANGNTATLNVTENASVSSLPGVGSFTFNSGWLISKLASFNSPILTFIYGSSSDYSVVSQRYTQPRVGLERLYKNNLGAGATAESSYQIAFTHPFIREIKGTGFSASFTYSPLPSVSFVTVAPAASWYRLTAVDVEYPNSHAQGCAQAFSYKLNYRATAATDISCMLLDGIAAEAPGVSVPTRFTYHPLGVNTSAKSVDYWGFSNGKPNTTLIPTIYAYNGQHTGIPIAAGSVAYAGADRAPSYSACVSGSLKSICYPTGATTTYEYEPSSFSYGGLSVVGNGLRIKQISRSATADPAQSEITVFDYSSGATPTSYSPLHWVKPVTSSTANEDDGFGANVMLFADRSGSGLGGISPAVTYRQVAVRTGKGATIYQYELPIDRANTGSLSAPYSSLFTTPAEQPVSTSNDYESTSFSIRSAALQAGATPTLLWNQPLLVKREVRSESGVLVASSSYTYGQLDSVVLTQGFILFPTFLERYTIPGQGDAGGLPARIPLTPVGDGTPFTEHSGTVGVVSIISGWRNLERVVSNVFAPDGQPVSSSTQTSTFVAPNRNFRFLKQRSSTPLGQETTTIVKKYCFEPTFDFSQQAQVSTLHKNLSDCLASAASAGYEPVVELPDQLIPIGEPTTTQNSCYLTFNSSLTNLITERAKAITLLRNRAMYDWVVEEQTVVERAGNTWVTGARFDMVKEDPTKALQPYKSYEFSGSVAQASFTALGFTSATPVDIAYDPRYRLVREVTRFGANGQVEEYVGADGVHIAAKYTSNGRFPVATGANLTVDKLSGYSETSASLKQIQLANPAAVITGKTILEPYGVVAEISANGQSSYSIFNSLGQRVATKDNDKNVRSIQLSHLPLQVGEPTVVACTDPDANQNLLSSDAASRFGLKITRSYWDTPCSFEISGAPFGSYELYLDYGDGSTSGLGQKVTSSIQAHKYASFAPYTATLSVKYKGNLVASSACSVSLIKQPFTSTVEYWGTDVPAPDQPAGAYHKFSSLPTNANTLTIQLTFTGGSGEYSLEWSRVVNPDSTPTSAVSGQPVYASFDTPGRYILSCTVKDKVLQEVIKTYTWDFSIVGSMP